MAFRRRMGNLAQILLQNRLQQTGREDLAQQQAGLQLFEAIRTNKDLATKLAASHPGMMIGGMPVGMFAQSPDEALNDVASGLAGVSDLTKLPAGEADMEALYHKQPGALQHGQDRPAIEQLMAQVAARQKGISGGLTSKVRAESVPVPVKSMNDAGVEQVQYQNPFDAADGGPLPVERTNEQEGTRQGSIKGAEFDATNTPSRQTVAAKGAGLKAGAEAAAHAPYVAPQFLNDTEGQTHAFKFGPGGAKEVDLPPGMSKGNNKLAVQQVDAISGLNTAEVEGVKILSQLHKNGLDQSNDPLDPRWQKFMVTTLKVAPDDWNKADIQQRTAFINAVLTRSLMGARPAQYVAQIIQQHLPQGEMTGAQLNHVINNVLQEGGERRTEVEGLTQRATGSLGPKSGMTYEKYIQSLMNEDQGPQTPEQSAYQQLQTLRKNR